mmetsp:Transcript_28354/g.64183  ORF Transcript_28354/g.64183 Transcript_28354/m.64183 type:complete len:503 (+) Transcript_28354:138-1646(+)
MDAMDGARDLLDKTEGPTSINPLVSPLIEATPLPAHPDYGLSGSTDNEYSESTTRSKSSELNQREAHRQMPVMPGMPGMPGLQMEQGDLSRGTSEDDFSSFFSSAIQLSSNSFTSDTSMSNSSSTRSPIIGGVAMGGGGGGGGGYHNAAAAKQAASALCAPSHDSYFPEGSGRGSGSGNLYGGADRDKYEHGHHDQNAQGQYNQADRFPNVSSPMLSTNTPSLPSPLSQHQHRTLPSASAPGTPSRALQMQEMQRIHQMQQAQMQMRHPLRGPSNSAPCTPVNAFRAMQHERQKWGDAPLLNTNTDGFGGGGGYGGGRQFQYEQGHSQQGQQGQQGQGRNAYNDSMQSQQHYQQQQQQQRSQQQQSQKMSVFARLGSGPVSGTRVTLKDLKSSVGSNDVTELCATIGEVKDVEIFSAGGQSKTAIVVFAKRTDAISCVEKFNGLTLDGVPMNVFITGEGGDGAPKSVFDRMGGQGGQGGTVLFGGSTYPAQMHSCVWTSCCE